VTKLQNFDKSKNTVLLKEKEEIFKRWWGLQTKHRRFTKQSYWSVWWDLFEKFTFIYKNSPSCSHILKMSAEDCLSETRW